jgi:hypothetical protein
MRRRSFSFLTVLFALVVMADGIASGAGGPQRAGAGRVQPQAIHSSAFAALQPVGEAEGWGRIVVRDAELPIGLHRMVEVWLFGMEPGAEFGVSIDGVELGTLRTRPSGTGVLKLQSMGRGHDAVPEELPPAGDLMGALVTGPGGPVLEGSFSVFGSPGGPTTYEEQITLEDVTGGEAEGWAKVEMKGEEHQEFKTHAAGLVPGGTYTVIVDGLELATLIADAQGQARLHREWPDDDNPLPDALLPVSEIVAVEWHGPEGLLLQGSFAGLGECDTFLGTVAAISDGGFTLETDSLTIEVATNGDTKWDDFGDHELAVGDRVKVEGCWDNDVLLANEIELKNHDHHDECGSVVGKVGAIAEGVLTIVNGAREVEVLTGSDTEWAGFRGREVAVGDRVKAEGCWEGGAFVARKVTLMPGAKQAGGS